jgi:Domain of unknown function (DUF4116)
MSKNELVVALDTNNEKLTRKLNETHAFNKLPKEPLGLILQRLSLFDALSFSISSKFISEKLDTRYSKHLETALWKPLFDKYFPDASHTHKSYRKSLAYEYNLILKKIKNNPGMLKVLNAALKKDKEVVLAVVKQNGLALYYADDSLKKDKEVVFTAVKQNGHALYYADNSLKKDKEVVLAAVEQDGYILEYADDSLKKNKDVVLAAVKEIGWALRYADDSLKNDKEVVILAVEQDGWVLEYADDSLKKDKEVVLAAVQNFGDALQFADDSLKKDKEVVITAVQNKNAVDAFKFANDALKKDKEVLLLAVKQSRSAFQYADESLLNDPVLTHIASILDDDKRKLICDFVTQDLNNLPVAQRVRDSLKSMEELSPQKATSLITAISKTIKSDKTIENDIKKALKDTSSELYNVLNQHSSILGLTFFGKKHWISSKTRTLQHVEAALENEKTNNSESKKSSTSFL